LIRTLDEQTTWVIGFRFFTGTLPGGSGDFLNFNHSAGAVDQCSFSINPAGTISAYRGDWDFGGVHLGTSAIVSLQNNTWYYLEFKVVIDDANGVMKITINGTTVLNLTGKDTKASNPLSGADNIRLSISSTGGTARVQDIHIFDGTGGVNDDMIGEYSVECLFPSGVGNSSGWTPSGGAVDNYTMVQEKTVLFPDDDTTYNAAAGAVKDTYEMDDLSIPVGSGLVAAVQVVSSDRKDDVGAVSIHHVIRSNAADTSGGDFGLGDDYVFTFSEWDTDPGFAAPWTVAHVNSMEAGMERV
jgi:hypothetical protein